MHACMHISYPLVKDDVTINFVFCRCIHIKGKGIPESCIELYPFDDFNVTYYEGDVLPGIKEILDYVIIDVFSNASRDLNQCAHLIGSYLCHFYFPVCEMDGRAIHPLCSTACNLLFNDEECSRLLINAISLITNYNISVVPDNDSCVVTHRSYAMSDQPAISEYCFRTEG